METVSLCTGHILIHTSVKLVTIETAALDREVEF